MLEITPLSKETVTAHHNKYFSGRNTQAYAFSKQFNFSEKSHQSTSFYKNIQFYYRVTEFCVRMLFVMFYCVWIIIRK